MLDYLLKYTEIDQDYRDTSEYYNFYSYCKQKMSATTKCMKEQLLTGVCTFKNVSLLHITYKLINKFYPLLEIPSATLNLHLANCLLKNEIYKYLRNNYDHQFEEILCTDLYNTDLIHFHLFQVIYKYHPDVYDKYMSIRDETYALNQIQAMLITSDIRDFDYYIQLIGHHNSLLCAKTSELIQLAIDQQIKSEIVIFQDKYIEFAVPIFVDCPTNFIFFCIRFIKEGELVKKLYIENDADSLKAIIDKYILYNGDIVCNINLAHKFDIVKKNEDTEDFAVDGNENFDFLFGGQSYKAFSDCIEI